MVGAQPLLLHSLVEFDEVIRGCFADAGVASVVEIGSESGTNTRRLFDHVGGELWCIEPLPTRELQDLDAREQRFHLVVGLSPGALEGIPPCDAAVIDGDHNYWTVARELEHVAATATGHHPLTILHDVAWPCGRRDQYYDPSALPTSAVHPHSWDRGAVPGQAETSPDGFRGAGAFAVADVEGGPGNGVRTAVEDHIATHDELRLAVVPAIFGLGVLWDESAPYADAIARRLSPLDDDPLLATMERNRLELFMAVLRARRAASETGLRQGRLLAEYSRALSTAEADAATLREQVARLRAEKIDATVQPQRPS